MRGGVLTGGVGVAVTQAWCAGAQSEPETYRGHAQVGPEAYRGHGRCLYGVRKGGMRCAVLRVCGTEGVWCAVLE